MDEVIQVICWNDVIILYLLNDVIKSPLVAQKLFPVTRQFSKLLFDGAPYTRHAGIRLV